MPDLTTPLAAWDTFYVIVGGAAAALTGLMFVVMSLVADSQRQHAEQALHAFGTPSVVHLCAALLISAAGAAPWHNVDNATLVIGVAGVIGLGYTMLATIRQARQTTYAPVFEDWLWHTILPILAYATFVGAAMDQHPSALYAIAAGTLTLLFIGIHNAWDAVTYSVLLRGAAKPEGETPATASSPAPHAQPAGNDSTEPQRTPRTRTDTGLKPG